ncbi:VPS13 protein [Coccidioides immitis RMSCC 3703]|uniref:VPS13 protein n=1 Tax=Coccidioides immitis RMSCC 3703 TaxID=454286 RepID=A0A0J8QWN4_COCIT|nr:VPS13 protein [Coccidioides immitis RMSCC 3703]
MQSLVTAIIDNIQVVIKNVHFRYEDSIAVPGHPFALGLTLKELSAVSTDSEWRPTFIQSTSETSHKLAVLGALAVYWNTDAELFSSGSSGGGESHTVSHEELVEKFRQAIVFCDNGQYILKPVSGKAGLELDKTLSTDRPRAKARLIFDELGFVLDDYQYRDALMLVDLFHYFIRHREYKRLQPKCRPTEDPRAWFRFAGNAVLTKIHERNRRWTWEYIKERRDDRIRYIELFKKQKRNIALSTEEEADLKRLEEKSTYEDLKFWRSLGRHQLRKENIIAPKQPKPQSWSEWIWGSKKEETEDENAMTEEQRKELYDAIDWDEKRAISQSIDVPRESVKLLIESSLRAGSFTLNRNRNGKTDEVLKLVFDNFKAKALQRHDSFLAQINLGGLRLFDSTTEGTLFPQIIGVKDAAAHGEADSPDLESLGSVAEAEEIEDSLFYLQFETNPLDGSADSALTMKLKSIEVIYNPRVLVEVVNFFRPPERHMESIGALLETAGATVEEIRQQTRAGLEFALEEHKTINAQLDIQAPVIIIPESITAESSTCLILDAGNVCVRSELVDKETIKMVQGKHGADYSDQDYEQLQNLMYDRFLLKLHSTQVLIGPGIETTKSQLVPGAESRNFHIMDRINIDFVLELCIVPKSTDLTRTRLSGRLPELHASMSDTKYKHLMKLIDIAIPHFDDDSEADSSDEKIKTISEVPDTRVRSSSVQLTSKEVPIVEQDSESDVDDTGDKTVQKPAKRPVNNHQRMFEFKFTVDRLRGSLYRSDLRDETKDTLLVELVAEHFQLDYYLRPYDMVAEIVLKSLVVDDHIEQDAPPEFKQIISSKGFNATEGKDLFQLKFIRVNPQSPEFLKVYEGTEMNLDLSISTINLIVTRKTLLTLLDFILITFTNPEQRNQAPISDQKAIERSEGGARVEPGPGRIRINSRLESIALIFNEDGVRLATLSLNTADVGIFVAGESLTVKGRMGSLTMFNDIGETTTRLLSIEGDDFADFRYQTFDPNQADYPGYSSEVMLRSGSIKINFIEEPYRRIINFLVKFGKMQAIFNAARQAAANQASQIQETASLMRFDIVVMTPILVFPRITENDRPRDFVTAHLGEIYANNKFEKLTEGDASANLNCVSAGIRHIRLTSNFYYSDEHSEELEMIEKVDLDFNIQYLVHQANISRPDIKVEGLMSPINLRISQMQLKLLTELSRDYSCSINPRPRSTRARSSGGASRASQVVKHKSQSVPNLAPEIRPEPDTWVQLDFAFKVDTLGLELILAKENEPVGSLDDASLSKFFLSNTNVKLQMLSDGSLETELLIHSFNVRDSRKNETNRYRKIMSLINTDVQQQFMASLSMTGGAERKIIAMLTIDSPRVIFALDYLFALQSFVSAAFPPESEPVDELSEYSDEEAQDVLSSDDVAVSGKDVLSNTTEVKAEDTPIPIAFRVNIVDAQAILVANPTISNSEAIVLGTKQVLYSQQNASTLQISKIGMFLCRMDKFETSRLRILDDFTLELSMDIRSKGRGCTMTRIDVHVDPLILRLSPRDIVLALQIMNKVSEMNTSPSTTDSKDKKPTSKDASHARRRSRGQSFSAGQVALCPNTAPKPAVQQSAIMKKEEMSVQIDGVRVILIGDLHMLPLVDWRVNQFNVDVRDWSGNMSADTTLDTLINVYNFSKSAWEPLIEPWQLGFHMSKEIAPDVLSVEAYSHKTMELYCDICYYRIDLGNGEEGPAALLSDGEERPWRFEDPTTMRESLAPEGSVGMVGVKLEGSGFDSINRIPLIREGETLYNLKPKQDRVLHRLLVEISLGSDYTQIPLEIGVFSPEEGHLLKIEKILPGDSRPAPIGAAYMRSLLVRPDQGFGYDWSTESLFWRDLLKLPTKSLKCNSESGQQAPPFYFRMHATFDKNDPIHNVYPYMRIRLSAPLEIQNLLPYDFKYRIYDRNTRKDWTNFLRKGGTSPVHVVELSHLLLLSIDMEDTEFRQCEFAIINGTPQDDFRKEHTLSIQDDKGVELKLGLHYFAIPDSGGSFKDGFGYKHPEQETSAGRAIRTDSSSGVRKAVPYMYSYATNDRKNRSIIKVEGSSWSKPQSLEAIGSTFEVLFPSASGKTEYDAGVSVEEGTGKYKITKLGEDLVAREPGSSNVLRLKPGDLVRCIPSAKCEEQMCLCFPGVNNQWASPFNISDLGTVYVKLAKASQRQRLLRIEILMEAATIFLHISMETRHWPFSMRNESDCEFLFYQANPNVAEDEEDRSSGWRPIRYRLPPRSIMPYAWDYPASKNKTLVLVCRGKERYIKLTEIGNLIPMRVPPSQEDVQPKIIDLRIEAEGPAQILVLSNYRPSRSIYRQQKPTASQSSISTGFEVKHVNTDVTFKAQLRLSGIGISLINKKLKELVYVTFRDIEVNFMLYIKYASVLLQQMTLELDEDFIFAMLDFVKVQDTLLMDDHQTQFGEELGFPEPKGEDQGTGVYFELLHIQPMQLDLSFVRTERVNVEDTVESSNPLMFFVNVMTMSIGNVNDAPVRLNALILENARISLPTLVTNITNHYTQDFLRQVHIVLGSADFLGNPVGLFNTVSSGVADIFYEPYQGLVADRPNELGLGIAKGATSFVKKSVFGLSDSLTKFTGSVSKGLAAATLDKEFQDQRRMSKARNRPKHALYGITAGGSAFASSMASGIGGLARHPLEGAEKEGFPGFMKGVAKGVWGLATKPAIGAFDLASNLAEGVRNTTTVFDPEGLDRVRLTRFIAMDGIVRPYSQREALGQFWLKTTDDGKYFNEDYIAHLEFTGKDMLVLLTYNRIMLVRSKKLATEWDIKLTDIQKISKERTGMSITLKGGANGPFIPVQEESSRNWLYKQIAIAVNAFNEKYLAKG